MTYLCTRPRKPGRKENSFTRGPVRIFLVQTIDPPKGGWGFLGCPDNPWGYCWLGTMEPRISATFGLCLPSSEVLIKFGITMCEAQSEFCLLCHVTCLSKHSVRAAVNLLTMGLTSRWPGGPYQIPPDPLLPGLAGRDLLFGKCFSSPPPHPRNIFSIKCLLSP